MNNSDLKRLMAQQLVLYKKLVELEDKVKGKSVSHADSFLIDDFKNETDRILKVMENYNITL